VFDIQDLSTERLVHFEESEFIRTMDNPSELFTKKNIYKKSLAQPKL